MMVELTAWEKGKQFEFFVDGEPLRFTPQKLAIHVRILYPYTTRTGMNFLSCSIDS
jgi:hypothetical protein